MKQVEAINTPSQLVSRVPNVTYRYGWMGGSRRVEWVCFCVCASRSFKTLSRMWRFDDKTVYVQVK